MLKKIILFVCSLISLLGLIIGFMDASSYSFLQDILTIWFGFSVPLIITLIFIKIFK